MNIVMLTNTYSPHVGGVARSVEAFTLEYRHRGHRVMVVAPEFDNAPIDEIDVVRIPAIQNFNGSDFSVVLPVSGLLTETLDRFRPDIVHAHHPYLLGMTALRIARYRQLPLVFTHHTLYEQYTHYVPGDSPALRRFVIELATRYANLCDQVFAPSDSVAALLRERGVEAPVAVVPTGVDVERFAHGDGRRFREQMRIPAGAFVVGHLGRLAPEKNLEFLAEAVVRFLADNENAHFLVVGKGPSEAQMRRVVEDHGLQERLHIVGVLAHPQLADALAAMDVFAFASRSETQGMVLTEAMSAGVPVVALDAPGAREVVRDGLNGRLLPEQAVDSFAQALHWVNSLPAPQRQALVDKARHTAQEFSMPSTAGKALACYESLLETVYVDRSEQFEQWESVLRLIKAEWDIAREMAGAAGNALSGGEPGSGRSG
ncbi:MAG: glycosyltransferase [Thiogranum sp.]|nr:glycosyltransferase [Thiogranum sp.]